MYHENPVFQILTTSGNQALLAAGSRPDALNNGQIGIFNVHTGLSVDGTVLGDCRDIFIAVGINRTTGGTDDAEDIMTSAGQHIQTNRMIKGAITIKGVVDEIPQVTDVYGFLAPTMVNTEYIIKLDFSGQRIFGLFGSNQLTKPYSYTSKLGDSLVDVAVGLAAKINEDPDDLVTATFLAHRIQSTVTAAATATGTLTITVGTETFLVDVVNGDAVGTVAAKIAAKINATTTSKYTASSAAAVVQIYPKVAVAVGGTDTIALGSAGGTGVTIGSITSTDVAVTDTAAFEAANPSASLTLRLTGNTETRTATHNDVNLKYWKAGFTFGTYLVEGFANGGTAAIVTKYQQREGHGYDLRQEEYVAGGWNGKPGPYRTSMTTGMSREGFEYFISASAKYNQVTLSYPLQSDSGFQQYENPLQTTIAIPCADTTTLTGLVAVLDLIFPQFQPSTNDVAAMDCTNVSTNQLTPATDGIEILA